MLDHAPVIKPFEPDLADLMICLVERHLYLLDPQGQLLIIEVYGYMPETKVCEDLCSEDDLYVAVEGYFLKRGIRFRCRFVAHFVSVIFRLEESLQYEVYLNHI